MTVMRFKPLHHTIHLNVWDFKLLKLIDAALFEECRRLLFYRESGKLVLLDMKAHTLWPGLLDPWSGFVLHKPKSVVNIGPDGEGELWLDEEPEPGIESRLAAKMKLLLRGRESESERIQRALLGLEPAGMQMNPFEQELLRVLRGKFIRSGWVNIVNDKSEETTASFMDAYAALTEFLVTRKPPVGRTGE